MKLSHFSRSVSVPVTAEELYRWHARPGAFERLLPPWERVEIVERSGGIEEGARLTLRQRLGPLRLQWSVEHRSVDAGLGFRDVQRSGPFRMWEHTHLMKDNGDGRSTLEDRICYALPAGPVGRLLGAPFVGRKLRRMFDHRHRVTVADLSAHRSSSLPAMKIAITGASGLIGSSLIPFLTTGGHEVVPLRRPSGSASDGLVWDPERPDFDTSGLAGVDAVVHLAGESIAEGRWTQAKKERIRRSRADGTRNLCEALAAMERPPKVLVSASAIGYYGSRGDELLDEGSAAGDGFLAEVCDAWEQATEVASAAGIRVVNLRLGVVLASQGGALAKMLTPFKLGVGGRLGSGSQAMSWIALEDVVGAIHHCLARKELSGPVNAVAPGVVDNRTFTKILGRVLKRPTILPMPAFAVRAAFGEMGQELLLSSARVRPARLLESGYEFRHPDLEGALRAYL